ncbi:MAG TPA: ArsA family ATPase, partial [Pseudonocardiaceae bacterium]|nr:ArsA family ATPase [Pseudonocardiaceae bacterium]
MRVVLFAGKGGVGKTTLAAATGASLSAAGHKTLLVSTDPAHSLSDALDVRLGGAPSEVDDGLFAAELDTRALLGGAWSTLRDHLSTLLTGAGVDEVVAEELTVLPGFEELLALSEVQRMAGIGPWEMVLVDCAPTAEAMRLLALPEVCAGYLERVFPAHRRMVRGMLSGFAGPGSSAQRWDATADALSRLAEYLESLRALVTDPVTTSARLVLTPERVVAAETRRSVTALALQGIRVDGLLANRLVPAVAQRARGPAAKWLRTRRREQDEVLAALGADLPAVPLRAVEHRAAEPVGLGPLRELAADLGGPDPGDAGSVDELLAADARPAPMIAVSHVGGAGLDSEYQLRLALPLVQADSVQLARVDDDLAVTAAGHRRLVALPSVLKRCTVTGAE